MIEYGRAVGSIFESTFIMHGPAVGIELFSRHAEADVQQELVGNLAAAQLLFDKSGIAAGVIPAGAGEEQESQYKAPRPARVVERFTI
jgi:putative NIF3 family GTP cyclohydrolase 1 type 2